MGVMVSKGLEREMALRGWSAMDLARAAGVSGGTITAARGTKRLSPKAVRLIARGLASAPPVDGIDRLLEHAVIEHSLVERNRQSLLRAELHCVRELLLLLNADDLEDADTDPVAGDPEPDALLR